MEANNKSAAGNSNTDSYRWLSIIGRFKWWVGGLAATSSVLPIIPQYVTQLDDYYYWCVCAALVPACVGLLFNGIPELLGIIRERRLRTWAIQRDDAEPGYFQLWPWEESDRERFYRPDGVEKRVRELIKNRKSPILYLTGDSGTGKTSLLNAFVIPELRHDTDVPHKVALVRSFDNGLSELEEILLQIESGRSRSRRKGRSLPKLLKATLDELESSHPRQRLLLVFDQFEELLILHERLMKPSGMEYDSLIESSMQNAEPKFDYPTIEKCKKFLREFLQRPLDSVTVLLVLRSDYQHLLERLDLPLQDKGRNWEDVGAFSLSDARNYWCDSRSGLSLGKGVVEVALKEASTIDQSPGLIRPIVMNMLGCVLVERVGESIHRREIGTLLSGHLKRSLMGLQSVDYVLRIVNQLIVVESFTKRPRSVVQISQESGVDPSVVDGCLKELNLLGLARRITHHGKLKQGVWEISHDFIVRMLVPVLESQHYRRWQRIRKTLTPALLFLWLFLFLGFVWSHVATWRTRIQAQLSSHGVSVEPIGSKVFRATIANKTVGSLRTRLDLLAKHGGILELDASRCDFKRADLTVLQGLRRIYLNDCPHLLSLKLDGLAQLEYLNLSGCTNLIEIDLSSLRSISSLYLERCEKLNTAVFPVRSAIGTLDLSDCKSLIRLNLSSLPRLKTLDLSGCVGLHSLDLSGLSNLGVVHARNLKQIKEIGLDELGQLERLDLTGCSGIVVIDVSDLVKLKTIFLRECSGLLNVDVSMLTELRAADFGECYQIGDLRLDGLSNLKRLDLSSCLSIRNLNVSSLRVLEDLSVRNCSSMSELNVSGLRMLRRLTISYCASLKRVRGLSNLEHLAVLDAQECRNLQLEFPNLPLLMTADVSWLRRVQVSGLNRLESLHTLRWAGLDSLEQFPGMPSLREIDISVSVGMRSELRGLSSLAGLTNLVLIHAAGLTTEQLESLSRVLPAGAKVSSIRDPKGPIGYRF